MSRIDESRRRFLRAVALGSGARVLAPIAALLHGTAYGAVQTSKKVVFLSLGAGLPDVFLGRPSRTSETEWSFHPSLAPLNPWRSKTLIVSGLSLAVPGTQHSAGYGMLSCTPCDGGADADAAPRAATIDQLLGAKLSAAGTMPALLFGIDNDPTRLVHQSLFASGPNQPVPYPVRESVLFERLFPGSAAAQAGEADTKRVMTRLRTDVTSLRSKLAGEERRKLDGYLGSLDAYDKRRAAGACATSAQLGTERGVVAELPGMLDAAVTALQCGMTNVVGCSIGGGNSHSHFPRFIGPHVGTIFEEQGFIADQGHDPTYMASRTILWKWLSDQVAAFLRKLEAPGPDGRRLIDDTIVVLYSDSGPDHHNGSSQRFIVIGDAGGPLRTGGRYLEGPTDEGWGEPPPNGMTVNSFLTALSTGLGVPMDSFGVVRPGGTSTPLAAML